MGIESIDVAAGAEVQEVTHHQGPGPREEVQEFVGSAAVAYHGGPLDHSSVSSGHGVDITAVFAGLFKAGQCGPSAQQGNQFDLGVILGDVLQFALSLFAGAQPQQGCADTAVATGSTSPGAGGGALGSPAGKSNATPTRTAAPSRSLAPDIDVLPTCGPQSAAEQAGAAARSAVKNAEVPADITAGDMKTVSVSGEETCGPLNLSGSASAHAGTEAKAGARSTLDANGFTAVAGAEASAGVGAEASGAITSDVGSITGHASADANVHARAKAYAHANLKGAEVAATADVGAEAKAEADVTAELGGGLVKGSAMGFAESGTGASATGDVAVSYDPLEAAVDGSAGAFAGARSGFTAKAGVAGASYTITGEAWSGAGAKAEFKAGYKDHKFTFAMGVGVAVGVGAFVKVGFEIDTRDMGHAISSIFGAVGSLVGGVFGGVLHSAGGVVDGAFGAVAGTLSGTKGDAAHADKVVTSFFDSLIAKLTAGPMMAEACP